MIDYVKMVLKDTKRYPKLNEWFENCSKQLPITIYMGKLRYKDEKIQSMLRDSGLHIIKLQNNPDEKIDFISVIHKIYASKKYFMHFNPFGYLYLTGVGRHSQFHDNFMGLDINRRLNTFFFGKEIGYRVLPADLRLQVGAYFNTKEDEEIYMKNIISELQEELTEELEEIEINNLIIEEGEIK